MMEVMEDYKLSDLMTVEEVSKDLLLSQRQILNLIGSQEVHGMRVGGRWLITKKSVDSYKARKAGW